MSVLKKTLQDETEHLLALKERLFVIMEILCRSPEVTSSSSAVAGLATRRLEVSVREKIPECL
jgi:hypothetical protein